MTSETWHEIHTLKDERLSLRAIARRLGIHRGTVRAALRESRPPSPSRPRRGSLIDPHRGWLLAKLEQYPELTASRRTATRSRRSAACPPA